MSFPWLCAARNYFQNILTKRGSTDGKRPFHALKVIEYGEDISAPYCTRLLAVWRRSNQSGETR